jgi:hypothetical protein
VTGKLKEELKTLALSGAGHSLCPGRLPRRGIELNPTVFEGKTGLFRSNRAIVGNAPRFFSTTGLT